MEKFLTRFEGRNGNFARSNLLTSANSAIFCLRLGKWYMFKNNGLGYGLIKFSSKLNGGRYGLHNVVNSTCKCNREKMVTSQRVVVISKRRPASPGDESFIPGHSLLLILSWTKVFETEKLSLII